MFKRILIANRGEIACRVIRTCKRLGIETVAVYSEADASARHVAEADLALPIGPAAASDSYLRADRILEAALASGAQAIHPGYGFLSEKLELIDACAAHGIRFIGPNRDAIAAMGSKIESKRLARAAGVLCVPGYDEDDQSLARLQAEAARIGYPVLIKASAGGGGKGMRRVDAPAEFEALLALARKEAQAAFGDDRVLLEKYIVNPRHLEVQLVGDRHGGLVHLFERECSIQRRFQKVIEEAPAHHLPAALADPLYDAALRIGRAIGYDNAGTVEFVLDADAGPAEVQPYFLEVNTRLQVEHPVTEMTTGVDLVEWQLRVAAGEPLPLAQHEIRRSGWAIECRLNAEEPAHGYRASFGPLLGYHQPDGLPGVRIDSGLHAASEVTPYYDSMLAKVIGFGASRAQATERARAGIEELRIEGVHTNAALLLQILAHPAFAEVLTTRYLDQHFADGPQAEPGLREPMMLAIAAAWARRRHGNASASAWSRLAGFRVTAPAGRAATLDLQLSDIAAGDMPTPLRLMHDGARIWAAARPELVARLPARAGTVQITDTRSGAANCTVVQAIVQVQCARGKTPGDKERWFGWCRGRSLVLDVQHALEVRAGGAGAAGQDGRLAATLPGRISEVLVAEGVRVAAGDPVLTLEAMKLYHTLSAPVAGQVVRLHVGVGDIVAQGRLLLEIAPEE